MTECHLYILTIYAYSIHTILVVCTYYAYDSHGHNKQDVLVALRYYYWSANMAYVN